MASRPGGWGYSAQIDNVGLAPPPRSLDWGSPPPQRVRPDRKPDQGKTPDADAKDDAKPNEGGQNDGEQSKPPMPRRKKLLYWAIGLLVLAALVTAGVLYWLNARHYETTDDAFIDGYISQIASQVAGRVTRIAFEDNQQVKAGQPLIELDPRDYQVRLDQANAQRAQAAAQLDQARAQLGLQQANLDQAAANVRVTEADLQQAQNDLARFRAVDPKAITRQQLDTSSSGVRSAQARLDANRQAVAGARAQIEAQRATVAAAVASVKQADVTVQNAELQLSYTHVLAPADGQVTRRTVELGNYVNPGQSLLAVVPSRMWVTANFKETQLALMQPGQFVRVRVDACPDLDINARVDSFQAGSGSAFSALPAENATGNYVKVVQRVPVRINFEEQDLSRCRMAPGMSVSPRVTVR
jgi:membrane fusion protein, multidrug efflux system